MEESETGLSEDLASVLDNDKIIEGQSNQRLKDFFKKLIQTDAQIRKLKQAINTNYHVDNIKAIDAERFKRSAKNIKRKHGIKPKLYKTTINMNTKKYASKETMATRQLNKRFLDDDNLAATGYFIKSEEFVRKYDQDQKKYFPKCSHSFDDNNSYERNSKHPNYIHSQWVNEMLESNKKLDYTTKNFDVLSSATGKFITESHNLKDNDENSIINSITKSAKLKGNTTNKLQDGDHKNVKLKNNELNDYMKSEFRRFDDEEHKYVTSTFPTSVNDVIDTSNISSEFDYNMEKLLPTTPMYDLTLSVPTFINPVNGDVPRLKLPRNHHLGQRNLLQVGEEDEDQEDLIYDDLKEVLADDKVGHDDSDRHGERKKRDYEEKLIIPEEFNQNKHRSNNIINKNWKGPMPLYPDELNAMIKQAAVQNLNFHLPANRRNIKVKRNLDKKNNVLSDTQYVEDYSDNNYNKLAKMAQAYSDYGVLNKKEYGKIEDKGYKPNFMTMFNQIFSKNKPSEDPEKCIKLQIPVKFDKLGSSSHSKEFKQSILNHVKICKNSNGCQSTQITKMPSIQYGQPFTPTIFLNSRSDILKSANVEAYTPVQLLDTSIDNLSKTSKKARYFYFTIRKRANPRTLKSIDMTYEDNDRDISKGISLNLDELNDTINEGINLTNINITDEENNIVNEANIININGVKDASKLTNLRNQNKIINAINELVVSHFTTKIDSVNNAPNIMKLNQVNKHDIKIYLPKKEIASEISSYDTNIKSLRALKSIEILDDDVPLKNSYVTRNLKNNHNQYDINDHINVSKSFNMTYNLNETNKKLNKAKEIKNTSDGIVSFISTMSDWLQTIASLSGDADPKELEKNINNKYNLTTILTKPQKNNFEENVTKKIMYPLYDVEMIDNIGHRSRSLLSTDEALGEKSLIKKITSKMKCENDSKVSDFFENVPVALVLATNDTTLNKTLNKRNSDENQVSWNDLYDEVEYGVKLDYTDNVRNKHSAKKVKNILNKSRDWLVDKYGNVRKQFKKKSTIKKQGSTTVSKGKKKKKPYNGTSMPPKLGIKVRQVRNVKYNENNKDLKKSFYALNANMKKVLQEAVKAIQDTKNIQVRENSKENEAASSLMQNLVRMMADLVDIQVQQKTCAKLPSDLYNFLEWLTAPNDDNAQDDWSLVAYDYNEAARFGKSTQANFDYPTSLTEDTHQDDRTECLGTIRAVQDLIQQYEGMTDEDKSKMTGVKEYLENQLLFLNTKIDPYDPNVFKLYAKRDLRRERRDTSNIKTEVKKQTMNQSFMNNLTTKQ